MEPETLAEARRPRSQRIPGFRPRAEIDWVEISVVLGRRTNFQTVQRVLKLNPSGKRRRVRAVKPLPGNASNAFTITLNAPSNWTQVVTELRALEHRFGFSEPPRIEAIEIALDFFRTFESADILALTQRMMTTLVADRQERRMLGPGRQFEMLTYNTKVDPQKTMSIGIPSVETRWWRVYAKTTDDGGKPLPNTEHRARAEFGIRGPEVEIFFGNSVAWNSPPFRKCSKLLRFRTVLESPRTVFRRPPVVIDALYRRELSNRGMHAHHPSQTSRLRHSEHTAADQTMTKIVNDCLRKLERDSARNRDDESISGTSVPTEESVANTPVLIPLTTASH